MPGWRVIVAAVALGVLASSMAEAQESPQISIHVANNEPTRALDVVEFNIVIALPTTPDAVDEDDAADPSPVTGPKLALMTLEVKAEGPLRGDYQDKAQCLFVQQGLSVGQQLEVPCFLHPKDETIASKLTPSLSAVFARDVLLQVHLETRQNDERGDTSHVGRVKLFPPLIAVFYGGVTGAFLLAVFRILAPLRHGLSRGSARMPATPNEWSQGLFLGVARFVVASLVFGSWLVLGGVSAVMIILLTKASTGELSPIQIEINDFVGGVLVGLLSFPVVAWLESKLLASESAGQGDGDAE